VPSIAAAIGCLSLILLPLLLLAAIGNMGVVKGSLTFLVAGAIVVLMAWQNAGQGDSGIEDIIVTIPVVGILYKRIFKPTTYYTEDTRIIFEETVHRVVLDVVGGIITINKMTPLTETEKAAQRQDDR
jgi:hypothetical protein